MKNITNRQVIADSLKNTVRKIPWLINSFRKIRRLFYTRGTTVYDPFSNKKFDKIPYIMHYDGVIDGLFSFFCKSLGGIAYADRHNFIPVIDMKNYKNPYLYDDEVGRVNSWEYYFEQPGNVLLEDVISCKKYIVGSDLRWHDQPDATLSKSYYNQDGCLDYWRKICKKYIRFKPAVLEKLEALQEKTKGKKILGVLVRGTDFIALRPLGHPIPPTAEQVIAKVKEVLLEKKFDAVYLATEDRNILAKFQAAFGEKLILPEADYVDYDYDKKSFIAEYYSNDKYLRGLKYLVSMLFLSKCTGLITSMTNGAMGATILSEGFEYLYVFDLGLYE